MFQDDIKPIFFLLVCPQNFFYSPKFDLLALKNST